MRTQIICCMVSVLQFALVLESGTTAGGVPEIRIFNDSCLKGCRLVVYYVLSSSFNMAWYWL